MLAMNLFVRKGSAAPSWIRLGFWAILDQALFALSGFVVNVLLARSLSPVDFGAFSIAFSVFLLASGFHNSLLMDPMLVLGAGKYFDNQAAYLKCLRYLHWPLCVALIIGLLAAGLIALALGSNKLATALLSSSIGAPGILFSWLVRRSCYLTNQVRLAAVSSLTYFLCVACGLEILVTADLVSATGAFILMSISGIVAGLVVLSRLQPAGKDQMLTIPLAQLSIDHWRYGRWIIGSTITSWVISSVPNVALGTLINLGASGTLTALALLIKPILMALPPLAMLATPRLARGNSRQQTTSYLIKMLLALTLATVLYWLVLALFGRELLSIFYGDKYIDSAGYLVLIGLSPVLTATVSTCATVLRVIVKPDLEFKSTLVSASVTTLVCLPLIFNFGLLGAVLTSLLSTALTAALSLFYAVKSIRDHR